MMIPNINAMVSAFNRIPKIQMNNGIKELLTDIAEYERTREEPTGGRFITPTQENQGGRFVTPENRQQGGKFITPAAIRAGNMLINRPIQMPEWQEQIGNIEGGALSPVSGGVEKSENLIEEAKKYKSAEEFIKSKNVLYHGGGEEIKNINVSPTRGALGQIYLSDSKSIAEKYAYLGGMESENTPDDIYNEISGLNIKNIIEYYKENNIKRKPTITDFHVTKEDFFDLANITIDDLIDVTPDKDINELLYMIDNISSGTKESLEESARNYGELKQFTEDWFDEDYVVQSPSGFMHDDSSLVDLPMVHFALQYGLLDKILDAKDIKGIKYDDAESGGITYVTRKNDILKTKQQLTDIWNKAHKQ